MTNIALEHIEHGQNEISFIYPFIGWESNMDGAFKHSRWVKMVVNHHEKSLNMMVEPSKMVKHGA